LTHNKTFFIKKGIFTCQDPDGKDLLFILKFTKKKHMTAKTLVDRFTTCNSCAFMDECAIEIEGKKHENNLVDMDASFLPPWSRPEYSDDWN
jgi:hypothetical protein